VDLYVIVFGVVLLVVLAVAVGLAGAADRRSARRAWRAIAHERRRIWEERQRNLESLDRCRYCPFRRPSRS
jgi:hypothetical protein